VLGALHTFVPNALPGVKTHKRAHMCPALKVGGVAPRSEFYNLCEDAARDALLGVRGI
jgi:hypothetical protein